MIFCGGVPRGSRPKINLFFVSQLKLKRQLKCAWGRLENFSKPSGVPAKCCKSAFSLVFLNEMPALHIDIQQIPPMLGIAMICRHCSTKFVRKECAFLPCHTSIVSNLSEFVCVCIFVACVMHSGSPYFPRGGQCPPPQRRGPHTFYRHPS